LTCHDQAPTGYDQLKTVTSGSATLLARDYIGSIAIGKCADLFLVDSRRLELTAACSDPKSVLATVGLKGAVDYTVVNGTVTVKQGCLVGLDEEELSFAANRKAREYLARC
ncbi:MAG: amidohydrolase family protein, partial [Firmicutes bacterium]|nr:amidohydrolase family protein [Bacillota bacterium]